MSASRAACGLWDATCLAACLGLTEEGNSPGFAGLKHLLQNIKPPMQTVNRLPCVVGGKHSRRDCAGLFRRVAASAGAGVLCISSSQESA